METTKYGIIWSQNVHFVTTWMKPLNNKCTSTRCGSFLHNYLALAQHYCLDQCLVLAKYACSIALAQYYWPCTTYLFLHNILFLTQHSCSCTTMKTLWIGIVLWISKSTKPCLWVVCELTIPFHSVLAHFRGRSVSWAIRDKNWSTLIANCSALRSSIEIILYFLKSWGQYRSIEYWPISVGGLWAEQFAMKVDPS